MKILETKDLCKYYRKTHALDHVSMTIERGDIYGFVGKNGAGKTTLIRVITGVAEPTSGTYSLFEETDPKQITRVRKRMAAVVENPALSLGLTAYENLMIECTLLGIKGDRHKLIEDLLLKVGLTNLLVVKKKKVKNFSLGMKQRLGIAMALISNPEFLVLDEPNNGLDPEGIRDMRELLLKLNHEDGVTILISSHILSELSKLATRYGFINQGSIVREITAEQLNRDCRKATVFVTDQPIVARDVLSQEGYNDVVLVNEGVKVADVVQVSKIISLLARHDIDVTSIREENEDLETYFMEIIKGAHRG